MAWYKPKDILSSLTKTDPQQVVTSSDVGARDSDQLMLWDNFMSALSTLPNNLQNQSTYLDSAFSDFSNSLGSANNEYQNVLSGLLSKLSSGDNKISFGLNGYSPVSFTSRQDRNDATAMSDLASSLLASKMAVPTATYQEAQTNNPFTTNLKLYEILSGLANQSEDRRYGTATTNQATGGGNAGLLSMLTGLTNIANAGSGLSAATGLGGAVSSGAAAAGSGLESLLGLGAIAMI